MSHAHHCNHSCTSNANHSYRKECNDSYMGTTLAERFIEIRSAAGDTPAKAAAKIGISRQGYNKWESGDTKNMTLANLLIFCEKYGIDVESLIRCARNESSNGSIKYSTANTATVHEFHEPKPAKDELLSIISTMDERQCYMAIGAISQLINQPPVNNFPQRSGT